MKCKNDRMLGVPMSVVPSWKAPVHFSVAATMVRATYSSPPTIVQERFVTVKGHTMLDPIPLHQRKFRLLKHGGREDGADILGGDVEWGNVHVSLYTVVVKGQKEKHELAVGESTIVSPAIGFRLYKEKGGRETYRLLRVS